MKRAGVDLNRCRPRTTWSACSFGWSSSEGGAGTDVVDLAVHALVAARGAAARSPIGCCSSGGHASKPSWARWEWLQTGFGQAARPPTPSAARVVLGGGAFLPFGLARPGRRRRAAPPRRHRGARLRHVEQHDRRRPSAVAAPLPRRAAARAFVAEQPSSIKIGVVAFSSAALVVQPPTDVKDDVLAAIKRLSPEGGTSIGRAILTSLDAIAGEPLVLILNRSRKAATPETCSSSVRRPSCCSPTARTRRLDPRHVAEVAAEAGVRLFPIGIGSEEGAVVEVEGFNVATRPRRAPAAAARERSTGPYFRCRGRGHPRRGLLLDRSPAHGQWGRHGDHRAPRRRRASLVRARRSALRAVVRAGAVTMSFLWSWALVAVDRDPDRDRRLRVAPAAQAEVRRALREPVADPRRMAAPIELAPSLAVRAAAARLHGPSCSRWPVRRSPCRCRSGHHDHLGPRRLAVDVRHRRRSEPHERRTDAARSFVSDQPEGTRFGLVVFAGTAQIVVRPTDRERLMDSIDGLSTSIGTAIGTRCLRSIDALAEVNPDVAPSTVDLSDGPAA